MTESFDVQDKSAHISSLNKTPASVVQEYAAKNRLTPQYTLVHNGIAESPVSFRYRLTLGDDYTEGVGSSKKEAKHEAALKLLKKMINEDPELLKTEFKQWDFKNHIVSPFDCNIKVNAIGQLNNICGNHRLGFPEFKLVREEGQAHAKLFTISCQVGKIIERATHKTKKQAKHLAAVQMLKKLETIDQTLVMENEPQISDSMKVLEQVESINSEINIRKNAPMDKNVCDFHLLFQTSEFSNSVLKESKVFKQYMREGKFDENNSYILLNQLVSECDVQLIEKSVSKDLLGKSNSYFYTMCVNNVYPPVYGSSVNDDIEKGKKLAALSLIKNILILLE